MSNFSSVGLNTLRVAFVISIMAQFSGSLHSEQVKLTIKADEIETESEIIRLADVVTIEAQDGTLATRVGRLDLDEIQIGQTVTLTKQQIVMRLRLAQFEKRDIYCKGPSLFTVKRVVAKNRYDQVKSLVARGVSSQFGIPVADVWVSIDENDRTNTDFEQGVADDSTVILPAELPLGKTRVRLLHRDSTGRQRESDLDCRISVMTEMLVAKRNLSRGIELTADDFSVVKRPLAKRTIFPASKQDVVGKKTRRQIPMHGIIRLADLTGVPRRNLVSRNDRVDIVYKIGSMTARVRNAKVLTPGRKGDRVEVLNPDSNKKLVASVVSETLLEIR